MHGVWKPFIRSVINRGEFRIAIFGRETRCCIHSIGQYIRLRISLGDLLRYIGIYQLDAALKRLSSLDSIGTISVGRTAVRTGVWARWPLCSGWAKNWFAEFGKKRT
jgi:hypothetical protein